MEEQIINTLKLVKNSQLKDINDIELKLLFPFNGLLNNLSSILDNPIKVSDLSIEELKKVLPDFDINIINKLESIFSYLDNLFKTAIQENPFSFNYGTKR